jgi:hypothetical protein
MMAPGAGFYACAWLSFCLYFAVVPAIQRGTGYRRTGDCLPSMFSTKSLFTPRTITNADRLLWPWFSHGAA